MIVLKPMLDPPTGSRPQAVRDLEPPAAPGTYALLMLASSELWLKAGCLETTRLAPGIYVYVGSALGPGGLRARVSRHLTPGKIPHWHVDHLTEILPVVLVCFTVGPARVECDWVRQLCAVPDASLPIRGFGSSDCREGCGSHLVRLPADAVGRLLLASGARGGVPGVGSPQHCQAIALPHPEASFALRQALLQLVELVQCIQGTERVHV